MFLNLNTLPTLPMDVVRHMVLPGIRTWHPLRCTCRALAAAAPRESQYRVVLHHSKIRVASESNWCLDSVCAVDGCCNHRYVVVDLTGVEQRVLLGPYCCICEHAHYPAPPWRA